MIFNYLLTGKRVSIRRSFKTLVTGSCTEGDNIIYLYSLKSTNSERQKETPVHGYRAPYHAPCWAEKTKEINIFNYFVLSTYLHFFILFIFTYNSCATNTVISINRHLKNKVEMGKTFTGYFYSSVKQRVTDSSWGFIISQLSSSLLEHHGYPTVHELTKTTTCSTCITEQAKHSKVYNSLGKTARTKNVESTDESITINQ